MCRIIITRGLYKEERKEGRKVYERKGYKSVYRIIITRGLY